MVTKVTNPTVVIKANVVCSHTEVSVKKCLYSDAKRNFTLSDVNENLNVSTFFVKLKINQNHFMFSRVFCVYGRRDRCCELF